MQIELNQTPTILPPGCTIAELLLIRGISGAFMAVAVNFEVIPKYLWGSTTLQEGDKVSLIGAAKGG